MDSYKAIFEKAHQISKNVDYPTYFEAFHDHPELFHFIMAPAYQYGPDGGALDLAQGLDGVIYERLVSKGPSLIGNGSDTLDGVESRHILLMTFLIARLGRDWGNVVEIGGGYGNCLRLVFDLDLFRRWDIIDFEYILRLQEWFLTAKGIDLSRIHFIDQENQQRQGSLQPDLVIGAHSLSEFSFEDFSRYFEVIKKSKWFFYASHTSNPSRESLAAKMKLILGQFEISSDMYYEGKSSRMYLFMNKDA